MRHRLPADALLLVTVLVWSFNFVALKWGVTHGFEPLAYSSLRFGVATVIFAGLTYAREGSLRIHRRDFLVVGVAGIGLYVNQICNIYAVKLTTASTVALCFGTLPIVVALIASATGIERLHARHWIAVGISFGGVALVASGTGANVSGDLGGILLTLATVVTWSAYSVAIGPLMRHYSPYRISAIVGIVATVPLLATSAGQLASQDWGEITTLAWLALGYSMLLALVLTNVLWFTAIGRVGAARSSLYMNLQPFLGAIFAVLVLSETMSAVQIAGGVVIGLGILVARQTRPRTPSLD